MNNDLISREALKKEFRAIYFCAETVEELANTMEDAIDNAPTVEYPFYQEAYQTGYEEGRKDFERPQGKWIFDREFTEFGNPYGTYKCSVCGCHSSNKYSFCKDCGADMRGKDYG